jgi:hypothetical protein
VLELEQHGWDSPPQVPQAPAAQAALVEVGQVELAPVHSEI